MDFPHIVSTGPRRPRLSLPFTHHIHIPLHVRADAHIAPPNWQGERTGEYRIPPDILLFPRDNDPDMALRTPASLSTRVLKPGYAARRAPRTQSNPAEK
jgi:hypothetical protein